MKRMLVPAVLVGLLVPMAARAQCTVTAAPVSFGTYLPLSATPRDSTGSVRVTCTTVIAGYTIALGPGGGGSIAARRMASGSALLSYQLYRSAARSVVWGDGTGGSATVSGTCVLLCNQTHSIYGRIPARQPARPGTYTDTVTVVVTF